MAKTFLLLIFFLPSLVFWKAENLNIYTVDLSQDYPAVISGHLKLGTNRNPSGDVLDANSLYFTKNGKPWYPVMGEMHFSRYPKSRWEESILKMKAAGIDVIASYIIWIHHEEEEGKFNWAGDNDLRAFAELCKKHNVYFFARIGPWCHGEVRNGGLPDWVIKQGNVRKNDSSYLASVSKFYNEIGKQLSGLYFKDGGPVIGSQIENEYRFNNASGLQHMLTLKKMAIDAGIDVPYYTATGWPGSNQKQDELIPVWGGYPEAPWDKKTTKLALSGNYLFGSLRNDPAIGSDLLGQHEQENFKGYRYPYATAEMGGGNQITYHRRPIISAEDVSALAYVKVGSGANLMGYYMFHGGSNPVGKNSTFQESKATKYPNDYPIISYDFLAPIGEWGQLRPSYRSFKTIHTFLQDFGDKLVQYYPSFPDKKPSGADDNSTLRMSVRSKDNEGFVFVSNYQRQLEMADIPGVQFDLKLKNGKSLKFPEMPISVKKNVQAIFPFNMDLNGITLNYATAQPFCRLAAKEPVYVFFAPAGITPEYSFDKALVSSHEVFDGELKTAGDKYIIRATKPGTNCTIKLKLKNGKVTKILTLSHQQIGDTWKANIWGADRLLISSQDLIVSGNNVKVQSTGYADMKFLVYPAVADLKVNAGKVNAAAEGVFSAYKILVPARELSIQIKEVIDIKEFSDRSLVLPLDERKVPVDPASPGPQYQTALTPVQGSRYFEIPVQADIMTGLNNVFLRLNYLGDTGSAYLNGSLIADDFYSGLPMTIGLKKFSSGAAGKKLLFQIVPLSDERQIYFEPGVRDTLTGKRVAELKSYQVVPQYEVVVSSGK